LVYQKSNQVVRRQLCHSQTGRNRRAGYMRCQHHIGQGELSRFQYKANIDFDLRCTDQEITAWGAMAMIKRMLDHLGLDAA
jgi:hypothetical protein